MRIVFVWITCFMLCAFITMGWYVCNTVVNQIATGAMDVIGSGKAFSTLGLLEWVNIAWGPILDFVVILWAIANSDGRGAMSDYF